MIYWLLIGVILWALIVGVYFIFNYGAHLNDRALDQTKTGDQDE